MDLLVQHDPALPALTGRVVDRAGILADVVERRIDAQLAEHEGGTGNQVVVVTVPSLGGLSIEEYGYRLGRQWGIGQAGRDNGVILLVAPSERKVRIEVGYGLEATLTDALAWTIIDHRILPAFRAGNLPGGIEAGAQAVVSALEGRHETVPTPSGWPLTSLTMPRLSPDEELLWTGIVWLIYLGGIIVTKMFDKWGSSRDVRFRGWRPTSRFGRSVTDFVAHLASVWLSAKASSYLIRKLSPPEGRRPGWVYFRGVGPLGVTPDGRYGVGDSGQAGGGLGGGGGGFGGGGGGFGGGGASGSW